MFQSKMSLSDSESETEADVDAESNPETKATFDPDVPSSPPLTRYFSRYPIDPKPSERIGKPQLSR